MRKFFSVQQCLNNISWLLNTWFNFQAALKEPGVALNDPCGSLPTWNVSQLCGSCFLAEIPISTICVLPGQNLLATQVPPTYPCLYVLLVPATNIHPLMYIGVSTNALYFLYSMISIPIQKIVSSQPSSERSFTLSSCDGALSWLSQASCFLLLGGNAIRLLRKFFLIFHVRILPLILKMCVCFFLIPSKTGGLFPLKCLVSWFIYLEMLSQGMLFPKHKTISAFLLPSFLCQPGSICSFKQTLGYSELLPHQSHFLQSIRNVLGIRNGNQDEGSIFINSSVGVIYITVGFSK